MDNTGSAQSLLAATIIIRNSLNQIRSKNARFWHGCKPSELTPPKTLFKTNAVVEGFWKGQAYDCWLCTCIYRGSAP